MPLLPTTKTPPKNSLADLTVMVYGPTKIGKTTLCSQAEGALFLATEPGLNALDVFQAPILNWEDLLNACAEISEGKHPFKTVIIDTIDNAYKFCTDYVLKKFKIEHESDLGYRQGLRAHQQRISAGADEAGVPALRAVPHLPRERDGDGFAHRQVHARRSDPAGQGPQDRPGHGRHGPVLRPGGPDRRRRRASVRRVIRTKPSLYYEAGDRTGGCRRRSI